MATEDEDLLLRGQDGYMLSPGDGHLIAFLTLFLPVYVSYYN